MVKISFYKGKLHRLSGLFFLRLICTDKANRFEEQINEKYRIVAFTSQQKSQYMTWYHEADSITQTQRNDHAKYFKRLFARNYILLWVWNFNNHGCVEIMQSCARPSTSADHEKCFKLLQQPPYQVRTKSRNWSKISCSVIQRILQNIIRVFPYMKSFVQRLKVLTKRKYWYYANRCLQNLESWSSVFHRML